MLFLAGEENPDLRVQVVSQDFQGCQAHQDYLGSQGLRDNQATQSRVSQEMVVPRASVANQVLKVTRAIQEVLELLVCLDRSDLMELLGSMDIKEKRELMGLASQEYQDKRGSRVRRHLLDHRGAQGTRAVKGTKGKRERLAKRENEDLKEMEEKREPKVKLGNWVHKDLQDFQAP